ncbi:MAG: 3-oxoacyl-ACP synthase III family protein [Oleiphilus sp.]
MTTALIKGVSLRGVASCVPTKVFDNQKDTVDFDPKEVKKVVAMAGVKQRRVVEEGVCASDLCREAARKLMAQLDWSADSVDALIMVTQSPDYFLPSTASLIHRDLGLSTHCAVFDVGLGCSGFPYGLWLGSMMVQSGSAKRVLVLHGETPSRFTHFQDRATLLLFGDAGSAAALEAGGNNTWGFSLHSDGQGYDDLIIPGGGFRCATPDDERDNFLHMKGSNIFNFTVQRVPELINDTLELVGETSEQTDTFIFHQSNQFIMKHIAKKCALPLEKIPLTLAEFGNTGGPSVPLTMTHHYKDKVVERPEKSMLLAYGVGLSWSSAYVVVEADTQFLHMDYPGNLTASKTAEAESKESN